MELECRPADSYRAARRNACKANKSVWSADWWYPGHTRKMGVYKRVTYVGKISRYHPNKELAAKYASTSIEEHHRRRNNGWGRSKTSEQKKSIASVIASSLANSLVTFSSPRFTGNSETLKPQRA